MKTLAKLISQAKKPTGHVGAVVTGIMNRAHSELTNWALSFAEIGGDQRILDIGCGGGKTVSKLAGIIGNGKVCGIDHSDVSVRSSTRLNGRFIDRHKVEIRLASVSSIPYPDNFFDVVTAIESYFFRPDLASDLKEVLRVLKPKGKLLLVSEVAGTNSNEKTIARFSRLAGTDDFMHYRTNEDLSLIFANAGFDKAGIHEKPNHGWVCAVGCKP